LHDFAQGLIDVMQKEKKKNTKEIFATINARNEANDEYCFFGFPMLWV
jgi:hypothetical protein